MRNKIKRNAVNVYPHKLVKAYICMNHKRQELLTELAIGYPKHPFNPFSERKVRHKHRTLAVNLDVICASILQRHAVFQRNFLYSKRSRDSVF